MPGEVAQLAFALLVAVSFATSLLTAAAGIGGGTVLIAVMAQVLPLPVVVPLHGVVQLASNSGRVLLLRHSIDRRLVGWFAVGALVGALPGGMLAVELPLHALQLALGAFILLTTWVRLPGFARSRIAFGTGGCISTLLTMLVGATGPLVMALLSPQRLTPTARVATNSACVALQHLLKIAVFGGLGFAFAPYLPLLGAMIFSGTLGTLVGSRYLQRIPAQRFDRVLSILLTALALRLLWSGLDLLLTG